MSSLVQHLLFWETAENLFYDTKLVWVAFEGWELRKRGTYSLHHHASNLIRIRITRRSPILKIPLPLHGALSRNANTRTPIRHPPAKLVNIARLMSARQPLAVALAVDVNVLHVTLLELLHRGLDVLHAAVFAHGLGGDVGVQAGAVPVAGDGLGSEGDDDAEFFGDAVEKEAGHPELVADCVASLALFHGVIELSGTYDRCPHKDRLETPIAQA